MKRKLQMGYKLYDKCVGCQNLGVCCDGPRTTSVEDLDRWCELMRGFKKWKGLTNDEIADESGVSLTTVSKIMSGNVEKDIRWNTVRSIEKILIGPGGQYPCPLAAQDVEAVKSVELKDMQLKQLQEVLTGIHESYKEEIIKVREDAAREIALYKDKVTALETQISELKTLVITRGRFIDKLIDKS